MQVYVKIAASVGPAYVTSLLKFEDTIKKKFSTDCCKMFHPLNYVCKISCLEEVVTELRTLY